MTALSFSFIVIIIPVIMSRIFNKEGLPATVGKGIAQGRTGLELGNGKPAGQASGCPAFF